MVESSRPRSVTILALGGFLLGLWNLWRVVTLISQTPLLLELGTYLDPRVRMGIALLWALWFPTLAGLLWLRRPAVRWLFPFSFLVYSLYHLALLALFMPAAAARQGWPATAVLFASALVWSILVLYRPAHRAYWRRTP